jgi:hypothetical protein
VEEGIVIAWWVMAAPFLTYGGELVVAEPLTAVRPTCRPADLATSVAVPAVFEPLFDASGAPVLARAGIETAEGVEVQLPTDARLHDGSLLTANDVQRALVRAAKLGCLDLSPWLVDHPTQAIRADPLLASVRVRLRTRPAGWRSLLASALIAVRRNGRWWGTGPFAGEGPRLEAFAAHRRGRPYLDRIRFAAARDSASLRFTPGAEGPVVADVYLRIAGPPAVAAFVAQVLDPEVLVGFLGHPARAAGSRPPSAPPAPPSSARPLTFDVSPHARVARRALERIQLDLTRAGLPVELRRREPDSSSQMRLLVAWSRADQPPLLRQLRPLAPLLSEARRRRWLEFRSASDRRRASVAAGLVPLYSVHYAASSPAVEDLANWTVR